MSSKPNITAWSERLMDRLAFSRDASLYRLVPHAVARPSDEGEVQELLRFARETRTPVTFRTGGTSLSGQAVTEGIVAEVVRHWDRVTVHNRGEAITLQPGVIGARANQFLRPYHRKIGPDPASINAAMIGGIISNNASGMVCGVKNNAYHTLRDIRFILANGHCYDTSRSWDYSQFTAVEKQLCEGLLQGKKRIESDVNLQKKIRRKYQIKNTLGYSLNAFLDYDHPLDIFAHLLVGAEGTLAFFSSVTLNTVPDPEYQSTGLVFFSDPETATASIPFLIDQEAAAVELMDSASLRTAKYSPKPPFPLQEVGEETTALLIELQNDDAAVLASREKEIIKALRVMKGRFVAGMTADPAVRTRLWNLRKGLYPTVGSLRKSGTSILTEDICYQYADLPEVVRELKMIFQKWSYHDSVIFGHAKDGNLHFVASIDLNHRKGIRAFDGMMSDLVTMTVDRFDGSLKAEHGTGRNMAPFVEAEWGGVLYDLMWQVKKLADPENILNPGVLLNQDRKIHLKHLKPMPQVHEEIDLCVECGFCERVCPSRELTLTPRHRIVLAREFKLSTAFQSEAFQDFRYSGLDTCAVDGMCATACPVNIDTGAFVKVGRSEQHPTWAVRTSLWVTDHFMRTQQALRTLLNVSKGIRQVTGDRFLEKAMGWVNKLSSGQIPRWDGHLPQGAPPLSLRSGGCQKKWIYYPTCLTRVFSADTNKTSLAEVLIEIGGYCGVELQVPEKIEHTCCGTPFSSKGFHQADKRMLHRTIDLLFTATSEGSYPVLVDTTPCAYKFIQAGHHLSGDILHKWKTLEFVDLIPFLHTCVKEAKLRKKLSRKILLHPTCSTVKLGQEAVMKELAEQCTETVSVPEDWNCCAFAGDRGLLFPELTRSATRREATEIKQGGTFAGGYSSSRTCEVALSGATNVDYVSIAWLVREYLRQDFL